MSAGKLNKLGVPPDHCGAAQEQARGDRGGPRRLCALPVRRGSLQLGAASASGVPEGVGRGLGCGGLHGGFLICRFGRRSALGAGRQGEGEGCEGECEAHDGHHVVAEGYIVEILRDGKPALPGEIGEVVITDLNNYCMPFLRYRIGDLAEAMADGSTALIRMRSTLDEMKLSICENCLLRS